MTRFQDLLCGDDERRAALRAKAGLYGIDFLEVRTDPPAENQRVVEVHFQDKAADPNFGAFLNSLAKDHFVLTGGVRVRGITLGDPVRSGDVIELPVSQPGDFSDYRLRVDHPQMDPAFAEVVFSFKAGCPSKFDCKPLFTCEPPVLTGPAIDYMAKDYASFRQALIDRISLTNPDWRERRSADFGIAIAELFAYAADYLSYYQDAVANEAYLETARQRISVRRHARLIDYRMHEGASSRAFVAFEVDKAGEIPAGTQLLTRIGALLKGQPAPPVIPTADAEAALELAGVVFELERTVVADPGLTQIPLHSWSRNDCCLPKGATTADLEGSRPLKPGDLLLLEEVKGLATGLSQDADPAHRQVVRLTAVTQLTDPLTATPLTRVAWDSADALVQPLCLSFTLNGTPVASVLEASGNIGIAHHGRRLHVQLKNVASPILLEQAPLSQWQTSDPAAPASALLQVDPRQAAPAVAIEGWKAVETLLDSDPNDAHFVTEIDNQGRGLIRFGDDTAGRNVRPDEILDVTYHTGLGPLFDVSSNSIVHVIDPGNVQNAAVTKSVRNPLPAWGGSPPEPIEDVKLTAPASLRTGLFRAVTEDDYARAAQQLPEVSKAVATFRWTGTWHTVFLTIDPAGQGDLRPELRSRIAAWVQRFAQTGYDLEISPPIYVPLDIAVTVCTEPDHFRTDVYQALLRELGTGELSGGRKAFFHPDRLTFGQPVFLSQLYAAITAVDGVRSARVTKLQRFGKSDSGELAAGSVRVGRAEVIRCDNDPNFAERGVITIQMEGGQ
ncbi:MAG: hypothetical protein KIT09_34460 [Bryobacteraceae bacterium]|nr:hypothetical protein [Bryobacteraceae bacterium]